MEEEEEIQSHASPASESHSPLSGRITVTVAAAAPPSPSNPPPSQNQTSLALALPIQQSSRPSSGSGSGGGGREDCWSEGATSVLIDAWGERYMELSRGNLKQKHWQEVADIVSSRDDYTKPPKTDIQCKNRIDTVKKKYKIEKAKVASGSGPSRWPFFDRLDRLIGPTATAAKVASTVTATAASSTAAQKAAAVPVGIPVGVRTLPLPLPHYIQQQQQQQQLYQQQQQIRQSNFASPVFPKFNGNNSSNLINASKLLQQQQQQQQQQLLRRGAGMAMAMAMQPPESDSEPEEEWSRDSGDSLPPETPFERRKRPRVEVNNVGVNRGKAREKGSMGKWGNSVRELTRAILKFGEAYEAAESAKLQQIVEMEKQRMKFAKELELQRIKFLMKTQLELSQLNANGNNNSDSRGGGSSGRRGGGGSGGGGGGGGVESNHHNHLENHLSHANSDSSN